MSATATPAARPSSARQRVALVISVALMALLLLLGLSAWHLAQASGLAFAVNRIDAIRVQAWVVATSLADAPAADGGVATSTASAIEGLDRRLLDPELWNRLSSDEATTHRRAVEEVRRGWETAVRAAALGADAPDLRRRAYLAHMPAFMATIDAAVQAVERDLQRHVGLSYRSLLLAVLVLIAGTVATVWMLQRRVFTPLAALLQVTERLRAGETRARAAAAHNDEFGQLAAGFNRLVEQMAQLAGALEQQVSAKTTDLARRNRSLALLYQVARQLGEEPIDERLLREVLAAFTDALGRDDLAGCTLRLHGAGARGIVGTDSLQVSTAPVDSHGVPTTLASFAIVESTTSYGALDVALSRAQPLEPWQAELAGMLARQLGAGLAAALAREEHRRLSVLEERNSLARELHDSLAQTLAYSRIQLMRLAALVEVHVSQSDAAPRTVLAELRNGLADAYRQLRELLTHFRIGIGDAGFTAAMRATLTDFARRTGLRVELQDELRGDELASAQHANVLAIVREALSNVERHAQASTVAVRLLTAGADGARVIDISVEDDGVGIAAADSPPGHFGLGIMRDRAHTLGGTLRVERTASGGTRIQLQIPLASRAAAAAESVRVGIGV